MLNASLFCKAAYLKLISSRNPQMFFNKFAEPCRIIYNNVICQKENIYKTPYFKEPLNFLARTQGFPRTHSKIYFCIHNNALQLLGYLKRCSVSVIIFTLYFIIDIYVFNQFLCSFFSLSVFYITNLADYGVNFFKNMFVCL